jgi:hypothetical protein
MQFHSRASNIEKTPLANQELQTLAQYAAACDVTELYVCAILPDGRVLVLGK